MGMDGLFLAQICGEQKDTKGLIFMLTETTEASLGVAVLPTHQGEASFNLGGLSLQAKRFASAVASQPGLLSQLQSQFALDSNRAWELIDQEFGPLSETDRQLLYAMAQVFLPGSSLEIVVTNELGCWAKF